MIVAIMTTALSGTAWADTSTLTFAAKCNGSGTADDGVEWTVTSDGTESNFDSDRGIHYGTNNAAVQYITLTTSQIPGTITKIVVNASGNNNPTLSVKVGGNNFGTAATNLTTSNAAYTFNGSASGTIVVDLRKSSSAKKALFVKSVEVTYTTGSVTPTCATPTFSPAEGAYTSAQNVTISTTTTGATIYYTTDGNEPTTSSSVYSSAIPVSSTTTIKAMAVKAGMDNSSVATATYTIVSLDHAGTEADPYTVADARTAIDANVGMTSVYATGIVSQIVTAYNSQYGNISYNISTDGTTTSDQLEVFRGKGINGANFTSADDIQVGDVVVVKGNLTKYGSTYEFAEGNQLVSLKREKQDPTIPSTPVSVAYGSTHTVTGIVAGEATLTSSNTAVATVEGLVITPVAVGTTTITVTTEENTYYNAGSGTFELTVTAPVGGTTAPTGSAGGTIFEETFAKCAGTGEAGSFSGTSNDAIQSDVSGWTFVKANAANGCGKFGSSSADGSATTPEISVVNGNTYTLTFKAAPWSAESETAMNVTVEGGTITGINTDAMTKQVWNEYEATITATSTSVKITFAASAHRFFLDDVKVEAPATPAPAITATLNGSGYATFCSEYPLDFTNSEENGYSAWQITDIDSDNKITFAQVTGSVKGGTGLFLKGEADATVTIPSADSSNELTDNKLVGTLAPTYVADNKYYGLSGENFVKVNAGTVKAGKAILDAGWITEPGSVKPFTFVFEGANDIETIENISRKEVEAIFNLAGQRTSRPTRGINIINGKKVLVR